MPINPDKPFFIKPFASKLFTGLWILVPYVYSKAAPLIRINMNTLHPPMLSYKPIAYISGISKDCCATP